LLVASVEPSVGEAEVWSEAGGNDSGAELWVDDEGELVGVDTGVFGEV